MSLALLFLAAFLACAVEMVEALTIVLAVGTTRGWRSPLVGAALAALALTAIVVVLGPAITQIPIDVLRLVVGGLLLVFGLQWLRKAILRASGHRALHDETQIFEREREVALHADRTEHVGLDWYPFTIAFKGVFLEGLEVAFIVLTFGGHSGGIRVAAAAAGVAFLVVVLAGVLIRAPLARVPENTMKFSVGALLTTFGIFWSAEGAGVSWPGGEAQLLAILAATLAVAYGFVRILRRPQTPPARPTSVFAGPEGAEP